MSNNAWFLYYDLIPASSICIGQVMLNLWLAACLNYYIEPNIDKNMMALW